MNQIAKHRLVLAAIILGGIATDLIITALSWLN